MDEHRDVCWSKLTPLTFIQRNAKVYAGKAAVIHGDKRYSYAEFGARINRLASALRAAGMQKGDRVAFLVPNIPQMLEAHFAVPLAGGVLVAINTRLSPREVAYILDHSGTKFLFVDTELSGVIQPSVGALKTVEQIINIDDEGIAPTLDGVDYESFLESGSPDDLDWVLEDEMELLCINYTSGTTGMPKGVMFSHRGAFINAIGEGIETSLTADSVYLWTLPMFHCNGWCFTWGVTALGGTHVCLRKIEPEVVWDLVAKENVTHFNGAPVVLIGLVNAKNRPAQLSRPLTVTTAGAPPSPTIIATIQALGAKIIHVYGLTETYGPYTVCSPQPGWASLAPDERSRLMARQGVRFVVADGLRVVDDDMNDIAADGEAMGEVVMQGNMVMKGYYDDPEATATAFRGGWFHSGDVAVQHPDGYIELRDRSKDIIISGGENISSIEVEQALYRHDAVLEVAVIGVPHEKWGETPKAFITLKEGKEATEKEIIDFCRDQIAHYKCPTAIEFIVLPKTSTGKIQKFVLRDKEWSGRETRIQGN